MGIQRDADLHNDVVIQYGQLVEQFLLQLLFRDVGGAEKKHHVAGLGIAAGAEAGAPPEFAAAAAPAQKIEAVVDFPGGVVGQDILPGEAAEDRVPALRVRGRGGKRGDGLIVGVAVFGQCDIGGGKRAFQPVAGDIEAALDAAVLRGQLGEIGQLLLIQLPDTYPEPFFVGDIHKNAIKVWFGALKQLGLDGDPFDAAVLTDQAVFMADGVPVLQLRQQLFPQVGQVLRVDHGGHAAAQCGEFRTGVAQKVKQAVIGVDDGEIIVEPAAEDCAGDVVVEELKLVLGPLPGRDVDAGGEKGGPSVRHVQRADQPGPVRLPLQSCEAL